MSRRLQAELDRFTAVRAQARGKRQAIVDRAERENRERLTESEQRAFDDLTERITESDARVGELVADIARSGWDDPEVQRIRESTATVESHRAVANAVAPLRFDDDELRQLHAAILAQQPRRIEARAFFSPDAYLPAQLWQQVVGPQHEGRILDRLISVPLDAPSVEWIRHTATTGTATVVAEGALKPEAVFTLDHVIAAAAKIACHGAVSWEILSDWDRFVQYTTNELMSMVIDAENLQFLSGSGTSSNMTGWLNTSGVLSHTVATETPLDTLEQAITALRVGPSLAVADLIVLHPSTFSAIRRSKDGQSRYLTQADPTVGQANTAWGVDVLVTTQIAAGAGLVMDTRKQGRVHVREPLSVRAGYSNDDFTRNIVRYVCEERLVLATERPSAVLSITGLPTS